MLFFFSGAAVNQEKMIPVLFRHGQSLEPGAGISQWHEDHELVGGEWLDAAFQQQFLELWIFSTWPFLNYRGRLLYCFFRAHNFIPGRQNGTCATAHAASSRKNFQCSIVPLMTVGGPFFVGCWRKTAANEVVGEVP